MNDGIYFAEMSKFGAELGPFLVYAQKVSFDPTETVCAPWQTETTEKPYGVQPLHVASEESRHKMSSFEELSDKIFTEEAGSTCNKDVHKTNRSSPLCVNRILPANCNGHITSPITIDQITITPRREKVNSEVIIGALEFLSEKEKMCYLIGLIADFPTGTKEWMFLK
jgi:hypothetical protein